MQEPEKLDCNLWVDKYGDMMYRFALVRVKDQDAAEEVAGAEVAEDGDQLDGKGDRDDSGDPEFNIWEP